MLEHLLNIAEIPGSIFSVKREKAREGRKRRGSERIEEKEGERKKKSNLCHDTLQKNYRTQE